MQNQNGFTLIELMITVAIIGILAALAIPNFLYFQCKSRQVEAKANLGAISDLQEVYMTEHETYTNSTTQLGFEIKGDKKYDYTVTVTGTGFNATAQATFPSLNGDTWMMDETRQVPENIVPGCNS